MQIRAMESIDELCQLKSQYMQHTTAPLDGMWLFGFVPMADHFGLMEADELVGYYCVNENGYLLQFFVNQRHQKQSSQLFESILQESSTSRSIKGAFVSTAEPHYLSMCFDQFPSFEVNALMYQQQGFSEAELKENPLPMIGVNAAQLTEVVNFSVAAIGAPAEWLNGYYANLIHRKELFGLWEDGQLIATGESRSRDEFQTDCADLGVIVAKSKRSRGIATRALQHLTAINEANGVKSICSTEKTNIAAQKAIERAGFFASNRIIQFKAST